MSKHKDRILHAVDMRGTVSVVELSQILGVSGQTIRRVSLPLVESGELTKVHGALVSNRVASDPPFLARMNLNRDAKVAIARKAVEIIEDGSSIAIDTGSTSGFIALALRTRKKLSVVTTLQATVSALLLVAPQEELAHVVIGAKTSRLDGWGSKTALIEHKTASIDHGLENQDRPRKPNGWKLNLPWVLWVF